MRLDYDAPIITSPIKGTQTKYLCNEEVHKCKPGRTTAVVARPYIRGLNGLSNRRHVVSTWRVLLDSGTDGDLLFREKDIRSKNMSIPYVIRAIPQSWHTSHGIFRTEKRGECELSFVEYSLSKRVLIRPDIVEWDSKDTEPLFDLIIGTETMTRLGIILDFKSKMITIDDVKLPMRHINNLQKSQIRHQIYTNTQYLEPPVTQGATKRAIEILDAKYEKADLPAVVKQNCSHLTSADQMQLLHLLQKYEQLFDGTLGDWKTTPVKLELKEGVWPFHGRAYPVPFIHKHTLKKEVERLESIGVLKWEGASEWGSPTFIIPKKSGQVRFLTDFREVNKRLKRKPWPIPKISTVLQELEGFRWATSLDLNMGYYTIRLDPDSQKICTIVLPWGKYSYQRLPMGIAGSPDIFQEKMSDLMASLEFVRTYLDDVLTITNSTFSDHLEKLEQVLKKLDEAGLRVNVSKSHFCTSELEYLGYVLTRDGIKPQNEKVSAILALQPPTSVKTLRHFLGLVQYYRDLWEKRSDVLAPLTDLVGESGETKVTKRNGTKKIPFHWDQSHQKAFEAIKTTIARDVVLAYPDYSHVFEIYTDASSRQLGAVITQRGRPIAFFSRKLSTAQQKYSVTELELLSIVETLKEFRGMLWGQRIKVYTDHQNLERNALGLTSNRVYRWRLLLEEYGPEIVHIPGIHNTVADAISRLEYDPMVNPTRQCMNIQRISTETGIKETHLQWKSVSKCLVNCDSECHTLDKDPPVSNTRELIRRCFANRDEEEDIFPLTINEIADAQKADKHLRKLFKRGGENNEMQYQVSLVEDTEVLTNSQLRLVLPPSLQKRAIQWYHHYLQHPGHTRLEETLRHVFTWHGMRAMVRSHVKQCQSCQINKRRKRKYGKLPTKQVIRKPWEALCVDLIGPYTLKGKDGTEIDFMCLTMIDPASSWFEMAELPVIEIEKTDSDNKIIETSETFNKTSQEIARLVNKSWFSRYPRSRKIIYDNGSEFKLHFRTLCDTYGLERKPTTIKNPQANAILERVHQVIMGMLRTAELDMAETISEEDVSTFLDDASWAIRTTHHTVLKASPGAAIFGRDMLFDIPFVADWHKIGDYRQQQTDRNTNRENARRYDYDYVVGGKVLIRKDGILRKAESRYKGPWTITQVHTNGTIRVQRGTRSERMNIRRVTPYHPNDDEDDSTLAD